MPIYTFELSDGSSPVRDAAGVQLPDRVHAMAYGKQVVRELMQGRELSTRCWHLRICEGHGEEVFEITFAALDRTLDHLVPELRSMVVQLCDSCRSCRQAVHAARMTCREARALVAMSRGEPYLAATGGERTIR